MGFWSIFTGLLKRTFRPIFADLIFRAGRVKVVSAVNESVDIPPLQKILDTGKLFYFFLFVVIFVDQVDDFLVAAKNPFIKQLQHSQPIQGDLNDRLNFDPEGASVSECIHIYC